MRHMLEGQNFGLCTNREVNGAFRHAFSTRKSLTIAPFLRDSERTYLFLFTLPPHQGEDAQNELKCNSRVGL